MLMPKLIWNTDRGLEDAQTESLKVVEFRLCTNKSAFRNRRHNEWGRSDWYRDEYEVGEMEEKNGNRSNLRGMGNISNLFKTQTTLNQVLLTHPVYISRKRLSLAICWAFDAPMHYLVVQPATLCSDHTRSGGSNAWKTQTRWYLPL